ncbi:MAG: DUF4087 domain-containing protein [Acidobacteriota bacterium]
MLIRPGLLALFTAFLIVSITAALSVFAGGSSDSANSNVAKPELRCGWFENPTPANAWLIDRDGEWTISIQGGDQAEGDWPDFNRSQWVETNGHYGYGCACLKVETDSERYVTRILSSTPKPLAQCRRDKALKLKEPK